MIVIFFNKVWHDPVWSKVIASGLVFLITQVFVFGIGIIKKISYFDVYKGFFSKIFKKSKKNKSSKYFNTTENIKLEINESSTIFFDERFCNAFPGFGAGYRWFNTNSVINNRLKILLSSPIKFNKANGHGVTTDPIWWFRGHSSLPIDSFEILKRKKILMNSDELNIEKIAAFRGNSYFEDFVYVQCFSDTPTGLYNYDKSSIEKHFNLYGEFREYFGIYKRKLISAQEYEDGSALIKGKPIKVDGAKCRTRNLTKYNFIIAAKFSPYNCNEFYRDSQVYFLQLLKDEITFDTFVTWLKKFPKNQENN